MGGDGADVGEMGEEEEGRAGGGGDGDTGGRDDENNDDDDNDDGESARGRKIVKNVRFPSKVSPEWLKSICLGVCAYYVCMCV